MIKLGIFYSCDSELELEVQSMKYFFKKKSINNKYLDHPVHMTIYVLDIDIEELKNFIILFTSLLLINDLGLCNSLLR